MKRYCVDGERMWFTDDLYEARAIAGANSPCVLLERIENHGEFRSEIDFVWWELERYEDESVAEPVGVR
jgi:hypothetical protein